MPDSRSQFIDIKLEKSQIAEDVVAVLVEDNDILIDRADVIVDDRNGAYHDALKTGATVVIDMGWTSEHGVLFEGEVDDVITVASENGTRRVKLTALDFSSLMHWHKGPQPPYTGKLSTIITQIVSDSLYSKQIKPGDIKPDPDPTFTDSKPLIRGNETDWEFIKRLANSYNARAFVEYNGGASKLYFVSMKSLLDRKPQGYLHYCGPYSELIDFSCQRLGKNAETLYQASVHDPTSGDLVQSPAAAPAQPDKPLKPDADHAADLAKSDPAAADQYKAAFETSAKAKPLPTPQGLIDPLPSDPGQIDRAKPDPTRKLGFRGTGTARGTIGLRAKGKVSISGVAPWADSDDWYVHQVKHVIQNGTYLTRFLVTR